MKFPLPTFSLLLLLIVCFAQTNRFAYAAQDEEESIAETIELWPAGLPEDAKPMTPEAIEKAKSKTTAERIAYVESPTLTVFPVPEKGSKTAAVVICPGGGYNYLSWQKEGTKVAKWFNSIGVAAMVLKYRVPRRDPKRIHWEPMQDVQRAIRVVRSKADEYGIDSDRIGVLGFSAGGHLTVMAGTQFETDSYEAVDAADELSCRPDFICPIYAAYLGNGYKDDVAELGDLVNVTKDTPPTFLAVTADDRMRGAQSALLFARLLESGVKAELHVWQKGGHGWGIEKWGSPCDGWENDLQAWLKTNGLLEAK